MLGLLLAFRVFFMYSVCLSIALLISNWFHKFSILGLKNGAAVHPVLNGKINPS